MTDQHRPPMMLTEPIEIGDVIDYQDFRAASRTLLDRRREAVRAFQEQARQSAEAEAVYQGAKASRFVALKASGGPEGAAVSATEAETRLKGDDEALIRRDLHRELLRARREDISGVDEALATLRRLAEWSQTERAAA